MSAGAPPQLSEEDLLVPAVRPTFGRRLRSAGRKYLSAVALTVALLVAWELIVRLGHVPEYLLPAPTQILADLKTDWVILWPAMLVTLKEVVIGFVIATVAGVGLAVVLHLYGPLRRAMYPILIGSQTIPIVVLAPILVILLGYGILPKLVIVALICFFPIVVNGIDGLRAVDEDFIRMMYTLDATRWGIFRRVEFPGALPSFFSGMRIAATFAAIGAVFGEWSGSNAGLGYVMLEATPNLLTARIFAAILMLTVISLVLFGLVSLLERIAVPWAPKRESV
ncbi:MAG TPA: ABC transporter permease [Streptosporangiaceae bacterium]|jgi:putative hydroxymethylpyrimidine transport system permease protein|nr:ABC transporter permease [Streptosporangiaceae bacterium]